MDSGAHETEAQARDAGELVYRAHTGQQAWCLCPDCTAQHARSSRRTKHDRWALNGEDRHIRSDLLSRRAAR